MNKHGREEHREDEMLLSYLRCCRWKRVRYGNGYSSQHALIASDRGFWFLVHSIVGAAGRGFGRATSGDLAAFVAGVPYPPARAAPPPPTIRIN
ncbi:hypothetical protein EVAR_49345_1 [Eumeta japonica]|uniref:Uncharacterized protein n=1 Tax=Eumeta variegata TaxID=151549 RepID=A0A4C1XU87_EUMVA|nr:hypothetical protein EVAR_49345_1 [Eumeta japonica]